MTAPVKGCPSQHSGCRANKKQQPKVKQWVRNIKRQEKFFGWLPTSSDYFYSALVAELINGRVLDFEYKGEPHKNNDDSREKRPVRDQYKNLTMIIR